jgi:hypothetical protein
MSRAAPSKKQSLFAGVTPSMVVECIQERIMSKKQSLLEGVTPTAATEPKTAVEETKPLRRH